MANILEHMQDPNNIKQKLLNSDSVKSLIIESSVFRELNKLNWQTEHSPYFTDVNSKKLRELDIKARRYFSKEAYSCDVDILVECKSLNNYHIIANNSSLDQNYFEPIWMGNYTNKDSNKLSEILFKYNFTTEEIVYIKEKLENYCVPKTTYRWINYRPTPFEIATFNTYRETNVNTTKDIDNSVVWKCLLSLQSAIEAHEELFLSNIRYSITEIIHQDISRLKKIERLIEDLINGSNHLYFIHPIIVVESKLWELTDENELKELKYFRLNIQKFFEDGYWVDIVNFDYLQEYLKKTKEYISFHKKRKFKTL